MLIVALQISPQSLIDTAETVVGLLLGHPNANTPRTPIASLHRPQQAVEPTSEAWLNAVDQSLDWVPLQRSAVERVWRVGVDAQQEATMSSLLAALPLERPGLRHVDALLGHPGKVSPWLGIAMGAQAINYGAGAQAIFSGGSAVQTTFCSTVLTPVPPSAT